MSEAKSKKLPTLKKLTEVFGYLDMLRESGVTNMYASAPYVMRDMGRTRDQACAEVSMWMKSFSDEPAKDRAARALSLRSESPVGGKVGL